VRILLVDNYDSFTYNLFHYLAEVYHHDPVVITNDDPAFRLRLLDEFDSVVLSPGPGSPDRASDFGICAEIIASGRLPVLGVCLGHQGLAQVHGGTVRRAPEPRHGRTSAIWHDGTGLFAGLPSPLEVVRYHSLAVTELPRMLEATAWAPDGVVMALRHRTLPQWGVQFHPESIGTLGGHQLLANFGRLAGEYNARAGRWRKPSTAANAAAPERVAEAPRRRLRVLAEELIGHRDPEVVFDRVFRGGDHPYWLDSSQAGGRLGEFSIMGDASGPLARIAGADVPSGTVTVTGRGTTTVVEDTFFDWLDRDLRSLDVETPDLPCEFALGWVGYLGYELKAQTGPPAGGAKRSPRSSGPKEAAQTGPPAGGAKRSPRSSGPKEGAQTGGEAAHRAQTPDATMVFADRAIVIDHNLDITYLLALVEDDDEVPARTWLRDTARTLVDIATAEPESQPCPALAPVPGRMLLAGDRMRPAGERPRRSGERLRLRHDRGAYLDLIDACQEEIKAGETYEVCLTNVLETEADIDPWHAYRFLRRSSPAPFAAYLSFGDVSVLSTSPERFLRIDRDGVIESKPIKGTRPRGRTDQEDALLVADLATSEKDHAENLMIVDLVRNDLGRCSLVGSVTADPVFQIETFAAAHQLVSTVRARLRADCGAVAGVRAAFPAGSMTGAPKLRTMEIIDRLEAGPRGVYSGAIGYFSLTGAADLSVVIRTVVMTGRRITYGVGGAIIALSDPEAEYEETAVKATPLLKLLGAEFPGRRAVPMLSGPPQ
jgi:para-aminobenzoate synthetase